MHAPIALLALIVEAAGGYPQQLFRVVGHPVTWIGGLIAWCEGRWNSGSVAFARRRINGVIMVVACLAIVGVVAVGFVQVADRLVPGPLAVLAVALAAGTLIAQRSLHAHVGAVADALENHGLEQARLAVSRIVGRDTAALDEHAVARAAIESLSENFSDGVVAPVFWLVLGGLPGAALYKAINTADSMIGHKSERHLAFGWCAARLDDLVNLPASRLSALLISAAAALDTDASATGCLRAIRRDARGHRSPNAGWPEAAMAGALGLKLAGPRIYNGTTVQDHWMGQGRSEAGHDDIRRALRLYRTACVLQACLVALVAALGVNA